MKYLLLIITLLLSSPIWGETVSMDDLVERNDLYYKKFTDTPFTGEVSGKNNGKINNGKINDGKIKNGKQEGLWKIYHENGQLNIKQTYKDGKLYVLFEAYYHNGQLQIKTTY